MAGRAAGLARGREGEKEGAASKPLLCIRKKHVKDRAQGRTHRRRALAPRTRIVQYSTIPQHKAACPAHGATIGAGCRTSLSLKAQPFTKAAPRLIYPLCTQRSFFQHPRHL